MFYSGDYVCVLKLYCHYQHNTDIKFESGLKYSTSIQWAIQTPPAVHTSGYMVFKVYETLVVSSLLLHLSYLTLGCVRQDSFDRKSAQPGTK